MSKQHGRYGAESILARSVVYNMNPMLSPEEDKTLARLEADMQRVVKKRCTQSATSLFTRDAQLSLKEIENPPDGCQGKAGCHARMPHIAALFRASSADVKNDYKRMAAEKRRAQALEKETEMKRRRACIEEHLAKTELLGADRSLFRSSASRFSESAVQEIFTMFNDSSWSRKRVLDLRAKAREIPQPTCEEMQKVLESIKCPEFTEMKLDQERLRWAKSMATRRQHLRHTAFLLGPQGEHGMWMFAMATLKPVNVLFTKLRLRARAFECSSRARGSAGSFWEEELDFHAWHFETDFVYEDASSISVPPGVEWYMLPGVTWSHNSTLFTDHEAMPFSDHMPGGPDDGDEQGEEKEEDLSLIEGQEMADLLALFPWAAQQYLERAPTSKPASSEVPSRPSVVPPPDTSDPLALSDAEIAGIFARVERKRLELEEVFRDVPAPEFRVVPRGGVNTFKACGMAIDSIRGQGSSDLSASWCSHYGMPKTATFAVVSYTMELAEQLAGAWCHKMNFFWHVWEENGFEWDFVFNNEIIMSYKPTAEWQEIQDAVRAGDAHYRRVQEIIDLRPH